jgi:hypothetical protein
MFSKSTLLPLSTSTVGRIISPGTAPPTGRDRITERGPEAQQQQQNVFSAQV